MARTPEAIPDAADPAATPKRQSVCKRVYTYLDGTQGNRAQPDATKLDFNFIDGQVASLEFDKIGGNCGSALLRHGASQWCGDKFNTAKGDAPAAFEAVSAAIETLYADVWIAIGVSAGPRIGQAVEAVKRALEADGQTVDSDRLKEIAEKMADKDVRDATVKKSPFEYHFRVIQNEASAKRMETARVKMESADSDLSDF